MKINLLTQAIAQGRKYVRQNPEKVRQATQRAGSFVDSRTGRKHTAKIDKATGAADRFIDKQR
ncbi:antitoxin [Dermacoccus abyssi]|uniref:antitoxin n=1 Tax=Dermacoccus sp. PAMC28757 TaxID=2762331 RepID=UPI00164EC100|nr:antitoxin [Dermacoccus sp. PAMC28757]QNK52135.1 antitoxin [Dermacoccus sp. PAMC28757]